MSDRQPIPPSITQWADVLRAEKDLLDYIDDARAAAAGIAVFDDEARSRKAQDILRQGGEVIKHMPNLIGPAKAALMQKLALRKIMDLIEKGDDKITWIEAEILDIIDQAQEDIA